MQLCKPSVLWRCWLGGRKGIRPVKTEWWGACVVICLEWGADLYTAHRMPLPPTVSCSSKIQIGFYLSGTAHLGSPGQRAIKRMHVCMYVHLLCVPHSPHYRGLTYLYYTHSRLTALFPGLPGWAGTRKVKPIWILLKQETVSGSGISWAICKSTPCSRQITTPAPHHSVFYRPDALPAAQPTASKHCIIISRKSTQWVSTTTNNNNHLTASFPGQPG